MPVRVSGQTAFLSGRQLPYRRNFSELPDRKQGQLCACEPCSQNNHPTGQLRGPFFDMPSVSTAFARKAAWTPPYESLRCLC